MERHKEDVIGANYNLNTSRKDFSWRVITWKKRPVIALCLSLWQCLPSSQAIWTSWIHSIGLCWLISEVIFFWFHQLPVDKNKAPKASWTFNSSYKMNYDDLSMNDSETYGLNFLPAQKAMWFKMVKGEQRFWKPVFGNIQSYVFELYLHHWEGRVSLKPADRDKQTLLLSFHYTWRC